MMINNKNYNIKQIYFFVVDYKTINENIKYMILIIIIKNLLLIYH